MKKYQVKINGEVYEVEVELLDELPADHSSAPAATDPAKGAALTSPMPGTILDVRTKEGDLVKKGDVLFLLEAMKMENEIRAPKDGRIASVRVSKGASVQSGDPLCTIE